MNERIKELVRQAVIAVDDPFPDNPLNDELEKMYIPDCFSEKFAELIVEECRNVVAEVYRNTSLELCGPLLVADEKIAEHFYGVEE